LEIAPFLNKHKKISFRGNMFSIQFNRHALDILITGVGMTATAFQLGMHLNKRYDLAINVGIAGSFRKNISLGTVTNVVSDCFADMGVEDGENFFTAKEIGLTNTVEYRMKIADEKMKNAVRGLHKVKAITVNTVHGNASSINKVVKKFDPDIESMEGAAFFFSCQEAKIPAIQIRSISNYVERRNKKKWDMKLAVNNLSLAAEQILLMLQ